MITTLKKFRKENPDLRGKKIILCEHLKSKTLDNVVINLWLGDNTRLLLCPVCIKVHNQTIWEDILKGANYIMKAIDKSNYDEYHKWLENSGRDYIAKRIEEES